MKVEQDTLLERLRAYVGKAVRPPLVARDPVNVAQIRHWCDAIGDANPVYLDERAARASSHGGIVAPPTMLQAWVMQGLPGPKGPGAPQNEVTEILDEAGFTSVVATNCEQEYVRYVRPGDLITAITTLEEVTDEKETALGVGHFVTTLVTYTDQRGEVVGRQRFRLLKFKPPQRAAAGPGERRPRPAINDDTRFFWEGVARGELLVQRCTSCGRLRHPPRPACGRCRSLDWEPQRMSGRGEVYSFVVHHYPPVPGFEPPFAVALVRLDEGPRIVSNIVGVAPGDVHVGMRVMVTFVRIDDELTLPMFEAF